MEKAHTNELLWFFFYFFYINNKKKHFDSWWLTDLNVLGGSEHFFSIFEKKMRYQVSVKQIFVHIEARDIKHKILWNFMLAILWQNFMSVKLYWKSLNWLRNSSSFSKFIATSRHKLHALALKCYAQRYYKGYY